jgi:putative hemolysin
MLSTLVRLGVVPIAPALSRPFAGRRWWRPEPGFTRKFAVDFRVGRLRVKTVSDEPELLSVLALRHAVFHREFAGKRWAFGGDRSPIDSVADHLAIFDEESGTVAGVYRLLPSVLTGNFYSASEFDLDGFLGTPGGKLELSRACIHKDYRRGVVIGLLWRGVAEYARLCGADYLFGLSSVPTTDRKIISTLHQRLTDSGAVDLSWGITPREGWDSPTEHAPLTVVGNDTDDELPPLFKSYLRAGARVCSLPVIDHQFRCADWLTVLDMKLLTSSFDRRYRRSEGV